MRLQIGVFSCKWSTTVAYWSCKYIASYSGVQLGVFPPLWLVLNVGLGIYTCALLIDLDHWIYHCAIAGGVCG